MLLSLVIVALLVGGCSNVAFVDEITFVNATEYPAQIDVSDGSRQRWLGLTTADPDQETNVREVIDQGPVWVFRFDYGGKYDEELEISGEELVRADWTIEVPQSFGDELDRLGVDPPP